MYSFLAVSSIDTPHSIAGTLGIGFFCKIASISDFEGDSIDVRRTAPKRDAVMRPFQDARTKQENPTVTSSLLQGNQHCLYQTK